MADSPIDIVIQDKIAPTIDGKLESIAESAIRSFSAVERLKAAMAGVNASALTQLASASARLQTQMAQTQITTAKLSTEQQRLQLVSIQTATAQQALARAAAQAGAAQTAQAQKAAAAASAAARSAQQLATEQARTATQAANAAKAQTQAAAAALRLQATQNQAAAATARLAADAERLKGELDPLYAAQTQFNTALARASNLLKQGAIDQATYNAAAGAAKAKLDATTASVNAFNAAQARMGKNAQINRMHLTNLSFQLNDIAVSLASGQNPLLVLVQQGSQIQGIASQAGVGLGRLAAAAAKMLVPFLPLVGVLGAFVGGVKLLASEATKGAGLKEYAKSLGATSTEIKKLHLDVVTFGDSMRGLWKTIKDNSKIDEAFSSLGSGIVKVFKFTLNAIANIFSSIISLGAATVDTLVLAWGTFGTRFKYTMSTAINFVSTAMEAFVNLSIDGVNKIISGINKISHLNIEELTKVSFGKIDTKEFEVAGDSLAEIFANSYMEHMASNQSAVNGFIAQWSENSVDAAKKRIKAAMQKDLDKDAESRATSLAKINAQLDNEISRMFTLRKEREAQARFDAIEEQLLGKKIKLNASEAASIKAKIDQIQRGIDIQREFDAVIQEMNGPAQDLENRMLGISKAVTAGAISFDQASQAIYVATEAYQNFADPMRQVNREYKEQMTLLGLNSAQREVEQQIMQIVNDQLAKGNFLILTQVDALRQKYEIQRVANVASQAEAALYADTVGKQEQYIANLNAIMALKQRDAGQGAQQLIKANPEFDFNGTQIGIDAKKQQYADLYTKLEEMRTRDLENTQAYESAKLRLQIKQMFDHTQNAQTFFSDMASLSSSGNKRLFKIGQAAALANAAITGSEIIMNAMATKPWYVGALLAVAASAKVYSQIAAIKSAKPPGFANGGSMMVGGSGGTDSQRVTMMASPGEKITVHTPAQAKALESSGGNVYVYNNTNSKVETERQSNGDLAIMISDIADRQIAKRVPNLVGSQIRDYSSPISKALQTSTTARPQR